MSRTASSVMVLIVSVALVVSTAQARTRTTSQVQTQTPPTGKPSDTAKTPHPDLEQLLKDYQAAFNKGDAKALAALYTENAIRLGLNNEILYGRTAIQNFYAGSLSGTPGALSVRQGRAQMITEDVAVLEGRYEVAGATGIHGVYFLTVVRQNGQWKFASVVPVPDNP